VLDLPASSAEDHRIAFLGVPLTSVLHHLSLHWWTWALLAGAVVVRFVQREVRAARQATHRAYLLGPEWRKRRSAALARADWRCEDCGHSERLQVHHLTYRRWGNEAAEDLRVLCPRCHAGRHRS
jgi:HNH endonuclease